MFAISFNMNMYWFDFLSGIEIVIIKNGILIKCNQKPVIIMDGNHRKSVVNIHDNVIPKNGHALNSFYFYWVSLQNSHLRIQFDGVYYTISEILLIQKVK